MESLKTTTTVYKDLSKDVLVLDLMVSFLLIAASAFYILF